MDHDHSGTGEGFAGSLRTRAGAFRRFVPSSLCLTIAALAGGWLVFYSQLVFHWSNAEYYNYGWSVAPLVVLLIWLRVREMPESVKPANSEPLRRICLVAAPILAMGVVLARVCMEVDPGWRMMLWIQGVLLAAVTLALITGLGGIRMTRHFAVPVLFLLTAIPWPTFLEENLVVNLTQLVSNASVEALRLGGFPAHLYGQMIMVEGVPMEIDAACSGIRSFQSVIMAALFLGEVFRIFAGWRVFLLFAGVVIAIICNILRSTALSWIAFANVEHPAVFHNWHDILGYSALICTLLGIYLITLRLPSHEDTVRRGEKVAGPFFPPLPSASRALVVVTLALVLVSPILTEFWYSAMGRFDENQVGMPWTFSFARANAAHDLQLQEVARDGVLPQNIDYGLQAFGQSGDGQRQLEITHFLWRDGRVGLHKALGHRPEYCVGVYLGADMLREPEMFPLRILEDTPHPVDLLVEQQVYRTPADGRTVHIFRTVWQNGTIDIQSKSTHWGRFQSAMQGRRGFMDPTQHVFLAILSDETPEEARPFAEQFFRETLEPVTPARIEFLLSQRRGASRSTEGLTE